MAEKIYLIGKPGDDMVIVMAEIRDHDCEFCCGWLSASDCALRQALRRYPLGMMGMASDAQVWADMRQRLEDEFGVPVDVAALAVRLIRDRGPRYGDGHEAEQRAMEAIQKARGV